MAYMFGVQDDEETTTPMMSRIWYPDNDMGPKERCRHFCDDDRSWRETHVMVAEITVGQPLNSWICRVGRFGKFHE